MKALLALMLAAPVAAMAATPFDGTWKTDTSTIKTSQRSDVLAIKDGMFICSSCKPAIKVKADGTDQPVKGHDYYDSVAVTVVDAQNVKLVRKLAGAPASTVDYAVSADGKTLTLSFNGTQGAQPVTATFAESRVGKAPKSGNQVTGSWKPSSPPQVSDSGLTATFTGTGDGLQMKANGQSYDAKFDGKQVAIMGDPGKTMASLKKVSANTVTETDYRDGKKVEVTRMTVSGDGKSMMVDDDNITTGTKMTYTMVKQP